MRKAIMDAMRPHIARQLKVKAVIFKVTILNVQAGCALYYGRPLAPGGKELPIAKKIEDEGSDFGAYAMLKLKTGKRGMNASDWLVAAFDAGGFTDAPWHGLAREHECPASIER